jgi:glycosyltransferase involved in cell wall biosynthesis
MRLLIISDTPHHVGSDGLPVGFGATVREYDQLATVFDEVVHIAPLSSGAAPANECAYASPRVRLRPIAPAGGGGLVAKLGVVRQIPRWVQVIRAELRDADAVHVRCPANVCLIALLVLALQRRPRIRWIQYAVDWSGTPGEALSYRAQRWLLRHNAGRALVTVNGSWPRQPSHVHTFDNPVLTSDELVAARAAASRKPGADPIRILFAGRFAPSKGPIRVVAIADRLRRRGVRFQLDLAGDGPERQTCEAFVSERALSDVVTFHGWLDRAALDRLYTDAHVFLLPSRGEGFPRAAAEAMAHGVVPVLGDCSCVRQVLAEVGAGVALPPDDVDGLVDAISDLVDTSRWQQQSIAAVAAAPRFTYDRFLDAIRDLVLAPPRASAGRGDQT